jgi:hypothetical protein
MLSKISCLITGFSLILTITSCTEKFDKTKWAQYDEQDGPDRDLMADDLLKNYKLIGLSHKQMIQLLGSPANQTDTTKTYYTLSEKYDVIDPVSGKDLIIKFNKDSIITGAEIQEWHKH